MIGAACESAEKVIADTRKAYFGTRQGPTLLPSIDKAQAAKIQELENLLRHAVNHGEGVYSKILQLMQQLDTISNGNQSFRVYIYTHIYTKCFFFLFLIGARVTNF